MEAEEAGMEEALNVNAIASSVFQTLIETEERTTNISIFFFLWKPEHAIHTATIIIDIAIIKLWMILLF